MENIKTIYLIIPELLFKQEQTPIKKQKKVYNPKTLKQIGRENVKLKDRELDKKLAEKMINP